MNVYKVTFEARVVVRMPAFTEKQAIEFAKIAFFKDDVFIQNTLHVELVARGTEPEDIEKEAIDEPD